MSKGSNRRREDLNKIRDNWDKIFGKRDVKEEVKETKPESKPDDSKANAK